MIRRRPRTYTAQATADRWLVTFAAEDIVRAAYPAVVRDEWAVITHAEAIVKAEWESFPPDIRALTEHRLVGDIARGLER